MGRLEPNLSWADLLGLIETQGAEIEDEAALPAQAAGDFDTFVPWGIV